MEIARPLFLLLLVVLPLLVLAMRGSLAGMSRSQRLSCLTVRSVILLALILALAGLRFRLSRGDLAVLFVLDRSASISPEAQAEAHGFINAAVGQQRQTDEAGIIGFARDAQVLQPASPALRPEPGKWPEQPEISRTALGSAMDFAAASFSPEKIPRLVLLSDGNDTETGAVEAASRLAQSGVQIFTVPLRNPARPEVLVEKLTAPMRVKTGEPFDLTARIRSNVATTAAVRLYQNQFLLNESEVTLAPGTREVPFPSLKAEGNFASYEVEVVPQQDTQLENNRAETAVSLRGEPRVLIVDREEQKVQPLANALRAENIAVEVRRPAGLPRRVEDLQPFDLFLLSDVSAIQAGPREMEAWRSWVQDFGGGFAMLGGEESFGAGGYFRTPVEQMLPVRVEHEDRQETPTVALLVVLDRSGSMAAQVAGQTKISLADRGAVYALNVLQPRDLFGVMAVDVKVHHVVPLAKPDNKAAIEQRIMSITSSGGGIYVYTSLLEAFAQLRDVPAKIKHVILFSDAADAEEKNAGEMSDGIQGAGSSLDIASAMVAARITTSVVALGNENDRDTAWLRQLAERGSGRFYLTNDALTLPQIFTTETMKVAQSSLVEEPFLAVAATRNSIIDGLDWAQSPLLLGYNATKPKPAASILLATERGDPLLATWRYGLGQTAAFTSDAKARWASEWLAWPGFGKFWAQLARGLMRKSDPGGLHVATEELGDELRLSIDALTPDGNFRNELPITISAVGTDGAKRTATAKQSGPGHYAAAIPLPEGGSTVVAVNAGGDTSQDQNVFSHARSYPREFLTAETNEEMLRRLAESSRGKFAPSAAEIFARPSTPVKQPYDLTPMLLTAALLLFPADIWLRRRTW